MSVTTETTSAGSGVGSPEASAGRIEELGRIILAYSEITERLQKSHEQLTHQVRRLQAELGEKNRQLERRNRLAALGEMAAGMAHEIRNPLGAIQLYVSTLAADFAEGTSGARTVEKIRGGVLRLESIVSKVLQFAREIRLSPAEGELGELVSECAELVAGKAMSRGVRVLVAGPGRSRARYDRLMMSQALLNVVQNAVEASPEGGEVRVTWGEEGSGGEVWVRVADSGPGVAAEVMDRIFNPFFTTKDEGTGLGLSIVHRIVEAHEGAVTVRNGEAGGAVFEMRWPGGVGGQRDRQAA